MKPQSCLTVSALLLAAACSSSETSVESAPAKTQQALEIGGAEAVAAETLSLDLLLPAGIDAGDVAVSASNSLYMGDGASVKDEDGVPSPVASLGTNRALFSTSVLLGTTWVVGDLFFGTGSHVEGDLIYGGTAEIQEPFTYTGDKLNQPVATQSVAIPVEFPEFDQAPVQAEPEETKPVLPGAYYGYTMAKRDSVLELGAGDYFFEHLQIGDKATLSIDQTAGPVRLYVKSTLDYKGRVVSKGGADTDLFLGYFGTNPVLFQGPMSGAVVAPNGKLTFGRTDAGPHRGSFFARDIEVQGQAQLEYVPYSGWLIDDVTVSNETPCLGESVEVVVETGNAGANSPVLVEINGLPGARQVLQFSGFTGVQRVPVVAYVKGGLASYRTVTVDVQECPGTETLPILRFGASPVRPEVADFVVINADELGRDAPTYFWEFGDGTSAETSTPFAEHDFAPALDGTSEWHIFDVQVRVVQDGESDLTAHKTVPVMDVYAFYKSRGQIRPGVEHGGSLTEVSGTWSASIELTNREDHSITFSERYIEVMYCDPTQDSETVQSGAVSVTIPANDSIAYDVSLDSSTVASDVCGVGVHLRGQDGEYQVFGSAYLRSNDPPRSAVTDPGLLAALKKIVDEGLVANPDRVTLDDLHRLQLRGLIPKVQPSSTATYQATSAQDAVGEACMPGEAADRPGLVCQPATDGNGNPVFLGNGLWIANATRGDAILSRACSTIGALLAPLGKKWSHTGMMVYDHRAIRHSTSASSRYYAHLDTDVTGVVNGIDENVLRYGWPGTVTQSTDAAYFGEPRMDEETSAIYNVQGFEANVAACSSDQPVVYPFVLRSDPRKGDVGRTPLRTAASMMVTPSLTESHYRFFGYSEAQLAADAIAPALAGWAEGTNGTMCSSYLWTAFRAAGIVMDQTTDSWDEPLQRSSIDGLFVYNQTQRSIAAHALFDLLTTAAHKKDPVCGATDDVVCTESADNIANQVVNCFAKDECQVNDDEDDSWQSHPSELGSGNTVAPDDMLNWDVYESPEPARFEFDLLRAYTWQPAAGTGTVFGTVYNGEDSTPISGATLTLNGIDGYSETDGSYEFLGVPTNSGDQDFFGTAWVGPPGALTQFTGYKTDFAIVSGLNGPIDLLLFPNDKYRLLRFAVARWIKDDDSGDPDCAWHDCNEYSEGTSNWEFNLDPVNTKDSKVESWCVDDEVYATLELNLELDSATQEVTVAAEHKLYEDDECNTDDLEDTAEALVIVPPDGTPITFNIHTYNNGDTTGGGDIGDFTITVTNVVGAIWPDDT